MTSKKLIVVLTIALVFASLAPALASAQQVSGPSAPTDVLIVYMPMVRGGNAPLSSSQHIVDHNTLSKFSQIPDTYITAASRQHMLFRHNSVGWYMSHYLDCMANSLSPRPTDCDAGVPPNQIIADAKYNRNNFQFEFNGDFCYNQFPGWYDVISCFVTRFDDLAGQMDGGSFKFGYTQTSSDLADLFFNPIPGDWHTSILDLEALEARHPDKKIFFTTSAIPQLGYSSAANFNSGMRKYALANNSFLLDIADIESHHEDGTPCISNGVEALCPEWTFDGGHPNALGGQRLVKAWWIMMARLAGWNG